MSRFSSRKAKPEGESSGNSLRDALARRQAADDAQEQQRETQAQDTLRQGISKWFNDVASELPGKVQAITKALNGGGRAETDFSYSAAEAGVSLRGAGAVELDALPGFKKLDETCKDLDISCTVTEGVTGRGRRVGGGQPYIHVNIDASQPYSPVTSERVKPHHLRR